MLKDITLGQYFPGNSIAHKLDPRTKILLVTLYIIALFSAKGWMGYAVMAVTLAACVKVSHVGLRALVRGLKLTEAAALAAKFVRDCAERTFPQGTPMREGVDFEPLLYTIGADRL